MYIDLCSEFGRVLLRKFANSLEVLLGCETHVIQFRERKPAEAMLWRSRTPESADGWYSSESMSCTMDKANEQLACSP
jgi:hypothetical protein